MFDFHAPTLRFEPIHRHCAPRILLGNNRDVTRRGSDAIISLPKGIIKVSDTDWEIPIHNKKGMRVPARIDATAELRQERSKVTPPSGLSQARESFDFAQDRQPVERETMP